MAPGVGQNDDDAHAQGCRGARPNRLSGQSMSKFGKLCVYAKKSRVARRLAGHPAARVAGCSINRVSLGPPGGAREETRLTPRTRDTRITGYEPLLSPAALLDELPLSEAAAGTVERTRTDVRAVLDGSDDRLLVIAGPCSTSCR